MSLESSLGLVPAAHAVDASLEPSQVLVVTSTPSSKAKRHAIDAKREAKSSDAAGRTMSLLDAPGREVYYVDPTERLVGRGIRRADGFVRLRPAWKSTSVFGCTDNSSLCLFSAMTTRREILISTQALTRSRGGAP